MDTTNTHKDDFRALTLVCSSMWFIAISTAEQSWLAIGTKFHLSIRKTAASDSSGWAGGKTAMKQLKLLGQSKYTKRIRVFLIGMELRVCLCAKTAVLEVPLHEAAMTSSNGRTPVGQSDDGPKPPNMPKARIIWQGERALTPP